MTVPNDGVNHLDLNRIDGVYFWRIQVFFMAQGSQTPEHVWLVMMKAMRALTRYAASGIEETFVEARPRNHLGRRRRHYASQTERSLEGAPQDGLSLPGRGALRLADAVRESCASPRPAHHKKPRGNRFRR